MTPPQIITRRAALAAGLSLLPFAGGGCTILGLAAAKLSGPQKVPPAFVLADEPTVVLVERASNPAESATEAHAIAALITQQIRESMVVPPPPPMVDPSLAIEFRARPTADGRRPRPSEVARACGASQAIYVDLTRYAATSSVGNDAVEGSVEASVWVFDARTGHPTWPLEEDRGHPVIASLPFAPTSSGNSVEGVREKLNHDLARAVSRLFTGWTQE